MMIAVASPELAEKIAPVAALLQLPVACKSTANEITALKPLVVVGEGGIPAHLNLMHALREENASILRILTFSGQANAMNVLMSLRLAHRFIDLGSDAAVIAAAMNDAIRLSGVLKDEALIKCVQSLASLPRLPSLFFEIEEVVHKPGSSLAQVSKIVERDQTTTSQILRLVNAAAFAGKTPVTRLSDAVTRIGINNLKALVLGIGLFSRRISRGKELDFSTMHPHAFIVAQCCRLIAASEGLPSWHQDILFLAGLLHDLGSLVLVTTYPARYEEILSKAHREGVSMCALEGEKFGADHAAIGGYLSRLWSFPDQVSELILYHHDPARDDTNFAILRAADFLAQRVLYGGLGEGVKMPVPVPEKWLAVCKETLEQ